MVKRHKEIVFRCDARPGVGGGHVFRCMSLAKLFGEAGWAVSFHVGPGTRETVPQLVSSGHHIVETDQVNSALDRDRADVAVLDLFRWDADEIARYAHPNRCTVFLGDPGRQPGAHDVVVVPDSPDCSVHRSNGTVWLNGPQFALVNRRFRHARLMALRRRRASTAVRQVLIFFGLTDKNALCKRVLEGLRRNEAGLECNVVLGRNAPSYCDVREICDAAQGVTLHSDLLPDEMAILTVTADVAFGSCGGALFERASLGLPSISVVSTDSQRATGRLARKHGASIVLEKEASVPSMMAALDDLLRGNQRRQVMSRRAALLCDGRGLERIVEQVVGQAETVMKRR